MISIVVPVYNASLYLYDCLYSIQQQTFKDFEVICVNDGSYDNSADICQSFIREDNRFILLNQKNMGVSAARNNALAHVSGDYICFVDSDDIIDKNYLINLYSLVKEADISVIGYSRKVNLLGSGTLDVHIYDAKGYIRSIIDEAIVHPQIVCMLYKTLIVKDNNLDFTIGCVRNEDTEFFLKYLSFCKTVHTASYVGYYYRQNGNSAVHKFNEKSLTFIEADCRISKWLVERNIYPLENYIVSSSIQFFVYKTARQSNIDIYDKVHSLYNVRWEMKKMLKFPRLQRRGVAVVYLILGRKLFYKLLSLL